jgi:glycine/D-amino acid oxidase-like deaminating enzyme
MPPSVLRTTRRSNNHDVVVIGAGVIGSSIALALSRSGRRVVVVDKAGGPGHGSTSASSAIVRFNYSTRDGVALAWESKHCWEQWADHLGHVDDAGLAAFRRTGLVMLDVPVAPRAPVLALFDEVGVPYEEWDAATLRSRVTGLEPGRFWPPKRVDDDAFWADPDGEIGAFFTPDAGYVDDPMLAAHNLAVAAQHHGAEFVFHAEVVEVRRSAGRVDGIVLSDGTRLDAPVVVNAGGPWSSLLNRVAGVGADFTIAVRPLRQEVNQVPGTDVASMPVVADLDLGTYVRPTPGGELLVGGTEPACDPLPWVDDPDAVDPHPTVAVSRAQMLRAARRFPALGVPEVPGGIVGVYDVASDWTPIYDRTDLDGFYVAMGTSGNQFKNAPTVGPLMAALIDAVEGGHDHDADPVSVVGRHSGQAINLGAFSRKRPRNEASSGTVIG